MSQPRRLDEVFQEHPVYFITACTHDRRHLLNNDPAHLSFVSFCQQSSSYGVKVGRYILMPDHLHAFVCITTGGIGLSQWLKSLKNSMSKHWRSHYLDSPHWQKGFFDHLIRNETSHGEKWKYMADNPIRAGLCASPADWPFTGEIHPSSSKEAVIDRLYILLKKNVGAVDDRP